MAGMGPEDVIELKHSLSGMAELLWAYQTELTSQGFSATEALRIVIGWQAALLGLQGGGGGE